MSFNRIAVIYNPQSGRLRERTTAIERFRILLEEAGRTVAICPTEHPEHAMELARARVAEGYELIVAHGGDGTMNEVLQGVVGTEATLGFWPGGTANVLAAEIHFPSRTEEVVQRILAGKTMEVTVGQANERFFLLMAGVGIDAAIAGSVDPWLKQRFGKAAFGLAALQFAWKWDLSPFRIQLPGEEPVVGRFVVAGNARSYGGGFQFTPKADLTDPYLDLCIFSSEAMGDYLRYAAAALTGLHQAMPGVIVRKVESVQITSAGAYDAPIQVDGEVVGRLPVTLRAVPGALRLLV